MVNFVDKILCFFFRPMLLQVINILKIIKSGFICPAYLSHLNFKLGYLFCASVFTSSDE